MFRTGEDMRWGLTASIGNLGALTMPSALTAIGNFLRARATSANKDLIDRVLERPGCEIQVNVSAGNGELVAGKKGVYSDGVNSWWSIRIPKNAMTATLVMT